MFKHEHRWHFLQVRSEFEQTYYDELPETTYRKSDFAYYVCNDCPDTDGEPNTIKRLVRSKTDVEDSENA